jgi:uncharacterized protein
MVRSEATRPSIWNSDGSPSFFALRATQDGLPSFLGLAMTAEIESPRARGNFGSRSGVQPAMLRYSIMKTISTFVFALLFAALAVVAAAGSDKPTQRILTVTGQDSVSIPATHAHVTVMIESREKTAGAASSQTGAASQKVLDHLKSSNVDRLQTGGLAVNPIFTPKKVVSSYSGPEETEISGYLAQWTASFEVPVERAGNIVSEAIERGVSRVTQFGLKATDEATAAAQREALKLAAKRARADADAVLEALGYTATGIVKIQVNGAHGGPVGRGMVAMAYSAKSAPALEGGVEEITGSVTLEVSY